MEKSVLVVVALVLFLTQVWAAVNKIRIYEKPDQKGDSHTFTSKYPDFSDYKFFLNRAQSYCVTGLWSFWDLPNFEFNSSYSEGISKTEVCRNKSFAAFNSGRFLGPSDFDTPAIALYEGTTVYIWGGQEYVVTSPAGNNIQFAPKLVISFGNSSWTLFTGKDFDGNSTCFTPTNYFDLYTYTGWTSLNSSFVVQSVVRGCDFLQVANNINHLKNKLNLN